MSLTAFDARDCSILWIFCDCVLLFLNIKSKQQMVYVVDLRALKQCDNSFEISCLGIKLNCAFENFVDEWELFEIGIYIILVRNVDQTEKVFLHMVILFQFLNAFLRRYGQIKGGVLLNTDDKLGSQY